MNPIVAALLQRQGGQQGGMPMQGAPQGMMGGRAPDTLPRPGGVGTAENPPPLTLAQLDQMKRAGRGLPQDWLNQISPQERASIMPQWSNG